MERGALPGYENRKVAFLFPGLGALRPGIGAALYRRHPVFAAELDSCDALLTPLVDRSVKGMVLGTCGAEDAEALSLARYGQPVQFAIEYALARLWMSWGVRPTSVAGHSMGEVAAGAVAGLFSLADAATLITARARLMESVRTAGCMVSVGAGADIVAPLLAGYPDVAVGAINAPQQCVISGGRESMAVVLDELTARNIDFRRLAASQASHSPLMTEVAADLREAFAGIRFTEPAITFVSTVTGQAARLSELRADYWVRHVAEPVNFMAAMRTLDRRGKHLFVEMGPFPTLTPLGKRCVPAARHEWVASIRPSDRDGTIVLDAVARAYAAGQPISWRDFHRGTPGRRIELPTYAFDRRAYRLPTSAATASATVTGSATVTASVAATDGAAAMDSAAAPDSAALLAAREGGERWLAITELIRQKVATLLEFPDLAEVAADADFTDLGMDSLLAVKLRKELCASLSVSFPTPEIFSNPTPRELAQFLDGQLEKVG